MSRENTTPSCAGGVWGCGETEEAMVVAEGVVVVVGGCGVTTGAVWPLLVVAVLVVMGNCCGAGAGAWVVCMGAFI